MRTQFMRAGGDDTISVLYQKVIDDYGTAFTPYIVSCAWLAYQPKEHITVKE